MTGRGAESDTLNFIKIVKKDEYTTYLFEFHSYTQDAPYFLKLIITQDDQETKLGYVKYIPHFEIPYVNPNSFTGSIQMLDVNMEIATENYFINGLIQPSSSHNTAARGVDGCSSTTVIITHNCTNGGNHAPGEPCGTKKNPLENDGYYEVRLTVFCPGDNPLAEVPEVFIDIAGPSGGATPANPVDANIALAAVSFKLYGELTRSQKLWWDYNNNNSALKNDLINYLNENSFVLVNDLLDGEALAFTLQLIEQARLNSTLNFDVNASANSPANIDRSAIDNNTPEGQRFNEVYNKLKDVTQFKTLFTDIFDGPQTRLNVKFEIHEHVYHISPNGQESFEVAATTETTVNQNDNNYIIKINKQGLIANGTFVQNKLENAQTIAHEAAHAFLHHLLKKPNSIATIPNIDQKDLKEILDALQAANPNQHEIIFNNLTETIAEILSSLKDVLTTPAQRAMVEDLQIPESQDPDNPNSQIWNWNTYFQYLSYIGLQGTIGFNAEFPPNSDALNKFTLYITYGRAYLNL